MYDLIIIGGGPAGLTAAVYAIRKRLNCLLVSPDLGGKASSRMAVEGLDSYQVINGADLVRRFQSEVEYLDFSRVLESATALARNGDRFQVTTSGGKQLEGRTVILATGVDPVRLDVPGADRYLLRGLSYSTISYAPLYVDKTALVIGSGGMALRGAAELGQIARQVYLVAPEPGELDTAIGRRVQANKRVDLYAGWRPAAFEGDDYLRRVVLSSAGGELCTLDTDVAFVELGLRPRTALVQGWVSLDPAGKVIVDNATATNVPGLFAAGDVTNVPAEQVLIAIGEGAKAALAAYEYLLKAG